jgi:hypothetical protein
VGAPIPILRDSYRSPHRFSLRARRDYDLRVNKNRLDHLEISILHLGFLLLPGQVALALNPNSQRLSIGDEFWPIDIAAGDHGKIGLDPGPNGSARA